MERKGMLQRQADIVPFRAVMEKIPGVSDVAVWGAR